ncbi:HEAT repeat domain-containing protein [Candidatus Micrarchaeota archaeon]|nr:HEAT repeat domain-containing protein [Candidatus Micrarchaeota archaeon]
MGKLVSLSERAAALEAGGRRPNGRVIPPRLLLNGKTVIDATRVFAEAREAGVAQKRHFVRLTRTAIRGEKPREQIDAIDCLVSFGGKAVPVLASVLEKSENVNVLKRVFETLVYLKVKRKSLRARISELAGNVLVAHTNSGLRVDAALCLVKYGNENAVAALIKTMRRDSRGTVRAACLLALNKIKVGDVQIRKEIVQTVEGLFTADAETGLKEYARHVARKTAARTR